MWLSLSGSVCWVAVFLLKPAGGFDCLFGGVGAD